MFFINLTPSHSRLLHTMLCLEKSLPMSKFEFIGAMYPLPYQEWLINFTSEITLHFRVFEEIKSGNAN